MSSVGWTPEFCTVCYKQCPHGDVYCSHECRVVDSTGQAPDFVHDSEYSGHRSSDHETDCSEYDDEDDEMPQLWLTKTRSNDPVPLRAIAKAQPQPRRRENGHFLYESPMLKPTSASSATNQAASPPLSPLLIPTTRPSTPDMHMSVQSVNTYKRWLADGAI